MLQTRITGTVGPVPIPKNRPALIQLTVDRLWFRISTKISSNSAGWPCDIFASGCGRSHDICKFLEISNNTSETVQDGDIVTVDD